MENLGVLALVMTGPNDGLYLSEFDIIPFCDIKVSISSKSLA